MKKVLFLGLLSLSILVSVSSCSDNENKKFEKKITVTTDTTVMMPGETKVLSAPRWSCSGKKLSQPKLVAVENGPMIPMKVFTSKDTTVTFNDGDASGTSGGNLSSSFDGGWGVIPDILKWLLAIILIAAGLWLLFWLYNNWPKRSTAGNSSSGSTPAPDPRRSEHITQLTALVSAMGTAGGGTLERATEDEFLFIKIGPDAPLVHVENSGMNSHSDGITVNVGDEHRIDVRPVFPVQKEKPEAGAADTKEEKQ